MISKIAHIIYVDGIININDLDFDKILLYEKSIEIFLIYNVADKTPYGAKPRKL